MNLSKKELKIIEEIKTKFGRIIDLEDSPAVIIEIIRNYANVFNNDGTGGVSPSSIAVAGPDAGDFSAQLESIIREVMESKNEARRMSRQVNLMWITIVIGFALAIAVSLFS